ncbi:MAG TPA: tetratricopeptide repeat protein [Ignavibacteria bacterium]
MKFQSARCPSCNGELQVPEEKDIVKCMYCGNSIIVREVINQNIPKENFMNLAETELKLENFEKALEYYNKVLEINPQSYIAWCYKAATAVAINAQNGVFRFSDEVLIYFNNAMKYASEEGKIVIKKSLLPYLLDKNLVVAVDSSEFSNYMKKAMREPYVDKLKKVLEYFPEDEMILKRIDEINQEIQVLNRLINKEKTEEKEKKEKSEKENRRYKRKESNKQWLGAFISLGTVLGLILALVNINEGNTKIGPWWIFIGVFIGIMTYIIFATIRYLIEE